MDAKTLIDAVNAIPKAESAVGLLVLAFKVDRGTQPAEFNFPAEVKMLTASLLHAIKWDEEAALNSKRLNDLDRSAACMELQLAFFNAGVNPPCSFIMICQKNGWGVNEGGRLVKK